MKRLMFTCLVGQVVVVHRRCHICSNPEPRQGHSFLPAVTALCGGGRPEVWAQHCQLPSSNGGAAIGHFKVLHRPQKHLNDRECCCRSQGATPGRQTAGGRRSERETVGSGGISEGGGNSGSTDYGRDGGHVRKLTPAPANMVPGREDVEHSTGGEGGEVPDELHPRDGSSSLLECVCPGPQA